MALNQNHTFEELEGIKCSVIEKNCSAERIAFLKELLEYNNYSVVVVKSAPPKVAAKPATAAEPANAENVPPAAPETFTIGVTDLSFNTVNAIYNRELKTKEGKIVTPDYWKQVDSISKEDSWYWKKK